MTSIQQIINEHSARLATYVDEVFPANKALVLAALKAAGVTQATAEFSGSGDSGQIDTIEGLPTSYAAIDVTLQNMNLWGAGAVSTTTYTDLEELVRSFSYDVIEASGNGGWENNDGADGTIVFNIEDETIEFTINNYFTDSSTETQAF